MLRRIANSLRYMPKAPLQAGARTPVHGGDNDVLLDAQDASVPADEYAQMRLLFEAIKDAQGTIRAIDTKVGILLAALAIPLPYIVAAVQFAHAHGMRLGFAGVFGWLALAAYIVAAYVAIRSLTGIGNAGGHVLKEQSSPDVFYLGGLYQMHWLDAALNRNRSLSRRSVEQIAASIPREGAGAVRVLVNELMALAFIRDVKVFRQRVAFEFTAAAFVIGILALIP